MYKLNNFFLIFLLILFSPFFHAFAEPDLIPESIWMTPDPPVDGGQLVSSFRIRNIGDSSAGRFRIQFSKINVPSSLIITDINLAECFWDISGLSAGEMFEGSSSSLPDKCEGDTSLFHTANIPGFSLSLIIDDFDEVVESDEENNTLSKFVDMTVMPVPQPAPPPNFGPLLEVGLKVNDSNGIVYISSGEEILVTWESDNFTNSSASCEFRNQPIGSLITPQPVRGSSDVTYQETAAGFIELIIKCYDGPREISTPSAYDSVLIHIEPPPPSRAPPSIITLPPVDFGFRDRTGLPVTIIKFPATSTKFRIGDRVITNARLNVRNIPLFSPPSQDSSTILGVHASSSLGTVIDGPILGNNIWWWKIDYDEQPDGWSAEDFLQRHYLLWNLGNLHSPMINTFFGQKKVFLGGWLSEDDRRNYNFTLNSGISPRSILGLEKIYMALPAPVRWIMPNVVFSKVGFHVNHPSIVKPPDSVANNNILYLYYSQRSNAFIARGDERASAIGFATSVNGGITWTNGGTVIGSSTIVGGGSNGYNDFGGESPSAIVSGSEIWIYYHTNETAPKVLRTRLSQDGVTVLGTDRVNLPEEPFTLKHVDVSYLSLNLTDKFILVANDREMNRVVEYMSDDGLNWFKTAKSPRILTVGSEHVLTPHREIVDENHYRIYTGWDRGDGRSHEIRVWEFRTPDYVLPATISQSGTVSTNFVGQATYILTCYNKQGEYDERQRIVSEASIVNVSSVRHFTVGKPHKEFQQDKRFLMFSTILERVLSFFK